LGYLFALLLRLICLLFFVGESQPCKIAKELLLIVAVLFEIYGLQLLVLVFFLRSLSNLSCILKQFQNFVIFIAQVECSNRLYVLVLVGVLLFFVVFFLLHEVLLNYFKYLFVKHIFVFGFC